MFITVTDISIPDTRVKYKLRIRNIKHVKEKVGCYGNCEIYLYTGEILTIDEPFEFIGRRINEIIGNRVI